MLLNLPLRMLSGKKFPALLAVGIAISFHGTVTMDINSISHFEGKLGGSREIERNLPADSVKRETEGRKLAEANQAVISKTDVPIEFNDAHGLEYEGKLLSIKVDNGHDLYNQIKSYQYDKDWQLEQGRRCFWIGTWKGF